MQHKSKHNRRNFMVAVSASAAWLANCVLVWADDWLSIRKSRRRVTPACSIPTADYQYGARSPSVIVRSLPALPQRSQEDVDRVLEVIELIGKSESALDIAKLNPGALPIDELLRRSDLAVERRLQSQRWGADAQRPKAKLIQLPQRELTMAHCRISDVALLIEPCGTWHLSLRADQNYLRDDNLRQRNLDLQLKRNAFHLEIRLLQSVRAAGENLTPRAGDEGSFDQAGKLSFATIQVPDFWVQREAPKFITRMGQHHMIENHFDDIDQGEFEFYVRFDSLTGSGHGVVQPWEREQ